MGVCEQRQAEAKKVPNAARKPGAGPAAVRINSQQPAKVLILCHWHLLLLETPESPALARAAMQHTVGQALHLTHMVCEGAGPECTC